MTAVIVSYQYYCAAGHSCICCSKKRVGRYVQSYVFHAGKGTHAADGSADCNFYTDFFVRCPFYVYLIIFRRIFRDLGTWCSRIGRNDFYTCFISSSCKGFIAQHDFLFHYLIIYLSVASCDICLLAGQ